MPKQIARQAPYLRRYARALTGSQEAGDKLVQAAMEAILGGSVVLPAKMPLRTALYRALHSSGGADDGGDGAGPAGVAADRRLQTLAPVQRAALLLTAMEGFTPGEAAQVLDCTPQVFDGHLDAANDALTRAIATDVMIIEDEPIIALDLTRLVREVGHNVVGTAATHKEAVSLAHQTEPGLVLADIRLADGSNGLDAAAEILNAFDIPVIFITAFPEHLLTGERPEPAFLITKPFREDAVKAMVAQALFFHAPEARRRSA